MLYLPHQSSYTRMTFLLITAELLHPSLSTGCGNHCMWLKKSRTCLSPPSPGMFAGRVLWLWADSSSLHQRIPTGRVRGAWHRGNTNGMSGRPNNHPSEVMWGLRAVSSAFSLSYLLSPACGHLSCVWQPCVVRLSDSLTTDWASKFL